MNWTKGKRKMAGSYGIEGKEGREGQSQAGCFLDLGNDCGHFQYPHSPTGFHHLPGLWGSSCACHSHHSSEKTWMYNQIGGLYFMKTCMLG